MSPSETTHEAKRIMSAAGIDPRIHLHDLRHSFATLLRQAGVSIEDISAALGHSEVRTTHNFYVASDRKAAGNTTCIISGLVGMEQKNNFMSLQCQKQVFDGCHSYYLSQ
jgi:integrase